MNILSANEKLLTIRRCPQKLTANSEARMCINWGGRPSLWSTDPTALVILDTCAPSATEHISTFKNKYGFWRKKPRQHQATVSRIFPGTSDTQSHAILSTCYVDRSSETDVSSLYFSLCLFRDHSSLILQFKNTHMHTSSSFLYTNLSRTHTPVQAFCIMSY